MTTEHRFNGVIQREDGSYVGACRCGETFTGPNAAAEPDRGVRKDAAWRAVAHHMVNYNPDLKAIHAQVAERRGLSYYLTED